MPPAQQRLAERQRVFCRIGIKLSRAPQFTDGTFIKPARDKNQSKLAVRIGGFRPGCRSVFQYIFRGLALAVSDEQLRNRQLLLRGCKASIQELLYFSSRLVDHPSFQICLDECRACAYFVLLQALQTLERLNRISEISFLHEEQGVVLICSRVIRISG